MLPNLTNSLGDGADFCGPLGAGAGADRKKIPGAAWGKKSGARAGAEAA